MESRSQVSPRPGRFAKRLSVSKITYFTTILIALLFSTQLFACATDGGTGRSGEARAVDLDKVLMCPVCPGESLDQSQTQLAYQMKSVIRVKINEGWTDQQILDYFVERYGSSVLLEPQTEGVSLLAWVVPPVAVLLSLIVLIIVLRIRVAQSDKAHVEGSDNGR